MQLVILCLAMQWLGGQNALAQSTALDPSSEAYWGQKLEEEYYSYLEDQLQFWRAERIGTGHSLSAISTKNAPSYSEARTSFEESRIRLEEFLEDAKSSKQKSAGVFVENIKNARNHWGVRSSAIATEKALALLRDRISYPQARKFSHLRWQSIRDVYGVEAEEQFLRESFHTREWSESVNNFPNSDTKDILVVWIQDPWIQIGLELEAKTVVPDFAKMAKQSLDEAVIGDLQKNSIAVNKVTVSNFDGIESQASELLHILQSQYLNQNDKKIVLLSSGQASAIVHQLMDLNPELRQTEQIAAWINWNGRLLGMPLRESFYNAISQNAREQNSRALASQATPWILTPSYKMINEITQSQMSRNEIALPLGQGFPIWSFIPEAPSDRSSIELREAIEVDGENWIIGQEAKTPAKTITAVLAKLSAL